VYGWARDTSVADRLGREQGATAPDGRNEGAFMTVSGTTIAERVVELKRKSAGRLPADLAAAFEAEIDRLVVAGVPTDAAMVGSVMPDGDLLDPVGAPTSLTAVRAGRTAVVVFYRGAWCPYCTLALPGWPSGLAPSSVRSTS